MRAGHVNEIRKDSGDWLFVDVGFSRASRTCGILLGDGTPDEVTFADLRERLVTSAMTSTSPLNLVIEAPLSVAFTWQGNPTGRSFEKQSRATRYWYVGLGCSVLVAATYLVKALWDAQRRRDIRLFEGFVSFKDKGVPSSHRNDVAALRDVVWWRADHPNSVIAPEGVAADPSDKVTSAFEIVGLHLGVPPVVRAMANKALQPAGASRRR